MTKFRNWFWKYPEWLLFGQESILVNLTRLYRNGAPFTVAFVLLLLMAGLFFLITGRTNVIVYSKNNMLIEGVVVGVNPADNKSLVQLDKISPLTSDSNKKRLEKDLIELIYESLIRVDQKGEVQEVLAGHLEVEKGKRYRFKLKDELYWHDGNPITVDDVIATFELLKQLEGSPTTSTMYSKVAVQMNIKRIEDDPKAFEFEVKGNNVIPGLFEALSFKILPAHLLKDVTVNNINLVDPYINRFPVGSGPYKFLAKTDDYLDLTVNPNYHEEIPKIERIRFKFFPTEQSALDAIKTGQIHTLVTYAYSNIDEIVQNSNLAVVKSNALYNQYLAIYFNLGENANTILKDVKVRQAISYAIDKQKLINTVLKGYGKPAYGPIPPISFAYVSQYDHLLDLNKAKELLDSSGWKVEDGSNIRFKNGVKLVFNLYLLDNVERILLGENIKSQLADIGVEIQINPYDSSNLRDILTIKNFDTLLYRTQTIIDPDRYQLFHSSQINDTGLNFSSWSSTETTGKIVDRVIKQVPQSDDDLDTARRVIDIEERKKLYKDFQRLMANDVPVVYLLYPEEAYIYNKRLSSVVLDDLNSIEQRFIKISMWRLNQ